MGTSVTGYAGRLVALLGLGASGLSAARALKEGGATVVADDDRPESRETAEGLGISCQSLQEVLNNTFAALIIAPGIPLSHAVAQKARDLGIPIFGDIELFCQERAKRAPHAPFVAVTGTNGKSTTVALIAHMLKTSGIPVQMGGNIGTPILDLDPPSDSVVHVVECSSFQIETTPSLHPTIGVFLNLTPDHLDRHGSLEVYGALKQKLMMASDQAIFGVDDLHMSVYADAFEATGRPLVRLQAATNAALCPCNLGRVDSLRGAHNAQNAAAAVTVGHFLGLSEGQIAEALKTFQGLPHRMEMVRRMPKENGRELVFVNDSKATNADSAARALDSFTSIFWIAGGRAKEGGIASLSPYFSRIVKAYLIGEAAEDFAQTLKLDSVPYVLSGTLEEAISQATEDARCSEYESPVILLSPACASYDQFPNFMARGDAFRCAVKGLCS
jgi:UDP-N-acetylmuramoylalanine--D-glutamate ligase